MNKIDHHLATSNINFLHYKRRRNVYFFRTPGIRRIVKEPIYISVMTFSSNSYLGAGIALVYLPEKKSKLQVITGPWSGYGLSFSLGAPLEFFCNSKISFCHKIFFYQFPLATGLLYRYKFLLCCRWSSFAKTNQLLRLHQL